MYIYHYRNYTFYHHILFPLNGMFSSATHKDEVYMCAAKAFSAEYSLATY